MMKLFASMLTLLMTQSGSSFLSIKLTFTYALTFLGNALNWVWNALQSLLWPIIQLALGVLEALEYVVNQFLGIDSTVDDYYAFAKNTEFFNSLVKTFRAICGVAIILIIIMTIFAIIKQEYKNAVNDMTPQGNNKTKIIINLLKKIMTVVAFPVLMVFVVTGVNSILTAFSRAIKGDVNMTVASQILASSTYDANKYRTYASNDQRIPIIISAYNADEYNADETEKLRYKIQSADVQNKLLSTALLISDKSYLTFKESLIYKNNQFANSANYGDFYESFICTPEQYQVMADFVDYAEKANLTFYIKSLDDENIDWNYVESSIYDKSTQTLTITYRDASDLNNNNDKTDTYTITYSMSYNMSSPISDALNSVMAMLGIGEYSDNLYKVMERDEDSTNIVNWSNDKVLMKLSDTFDLNDVSTWTESDQIIMYEYYRYPANNTFSGVTLDTLKTVGFELDAKQIVYHDYYPEADAFSHEKVVNVVDINNNYYRIKKSNTLIDGNGNYYYILETIVGDTASDVFLNRGYSTIEKVIDSVDGDNNPIYKTANLKLSGNFDINDPESWTYSDEVIVYEYYSNLSMSNIFYANSFEDFRTGVELPVYQIVEYTYNSGTYGTYSTENYLLINGVYYKLNNNYELLSGATSFLTKALTSETIQYKFDVKIKDTTNIYGITTEIAYDADSLIYDSTDVNADVYTDEDGVLTNFKLLDLNDLTTEEQAKFDEIVNMQAFSLMFSKNFDYRNVSTWTYRDYFLFYLYAKYPQIVGTSGLTILKNTGLSWELGKVEMGASPDEKEYFVYRIKVDVDDYVYIDAEKVRKISQFKMTEELDANSTLSNNSISSTSDYSLFYTITSWGDSSLSTADITYRTFKFSDTFSESAVESWSVEDMILMHLINKGFISSDVESIKEFGYNSFVYTLADGDTYYRFGKAWDANTYDKTLFLSEKAVLNMRSYAGNKIATTFDSWLNMGSIDFIAKKLDVSKDNIIFRNSEMVTHLYDTYKNNVYNIDTFIDKITEEYVLSAETKQDDVVLLKDILQYKYVRSADYNSEDLTTWTQMDMLLYALLGQTFDEYSSNVVITSDGDLFFLIGEKAIKLAGDFSADLKNNNSLHSKNIEFSGATIDDVKNEYSNYDHLIYVGKSVAQNSNIQSIADKNLYKLLNATFKYSPTCVDGTNIIAENVTIFDVLLAEHFDEISEKSFEIYTDGFEVYLLLKSRAEATDEKGIYVKISNVSTSEIYYNSNLELELVSEQKPFIKEGSIKLFENINEFLGDDEKLIEEMQFSELERVVYDVTGKYDTKEYDIFTHDLKKYICNDGLFIEITGLGTNVKTIEELNLELGSDSENEAKIKYLYDNYYSAFVESKVTGFLNTEDAIKYIYQTYFPETAMTQSSDNEVAVHINFNISNVATWTPLAIILKNLNYSNNALHANIYGTLKVKNNNNIYLYLSNNVDGKEYEHYINITSFMTVYPPDVMINNEQIKTDIDDIVELLLKSFNLTMSGGVVSNRIDVLTLQDYMIEKVLEPINGTGVKDVTELYTTKAANFKLNEVATWNWFDLVYYYLNVEERTETDYLMYYYKKDTGGFEKYFKFESENSYSYIQDKDNFRIFFDANKFTEIENFNIDENNTSTDPLTIIHNKLTNITTRTRLYKYQFGQESDFFYFIEDKYTGEWRCVYKVDSTTINVEKDDQNYKYEPKSIIYEVNNNTYDWSVFDYFLAYILGTVGHPRIQLKKQVYNNITYVVHENVFIRVDGFDKDIVTFDNVNYELKTDGCLKVMDLLKNSSDDTSNVLYSFETVDDCPTEIKDPTITPTDIIENVYFTKGFDISDFSTWKLSDFIIYYLFEQGHFVDTTFGTNGDMVDDTIQNFQDLVTQGYVSAYVYYLLSSDDYGHVRAQKVYSFTVNEGGVSNSLYVNYDLFKLLYTRKLIGTVVNQTENELSMFINDEANLTYAKNPKSFYIDVINDLTAKDFEYNNYYYYKVDYSLFEKAGLQTDDKEIVNAINSGNAISENSINLKLSDSFIDDNGKFKMADVDDWTLLDYIIINEYSKNVKSNVFYGIDIADLAFGDNMFILYKTSKVQTPTDPNAEPVTVDTYVIAINGTYYNVTNWIEDDPTNPLSKEKFITTKQVTNLENSLTYDLSDIIVSSTTNNYSFKTLTEKIAYNVFRDGNGSLYEIPANKYTFSFTSAFVRNINGTDVDNNVKFVRTVNERINPNFTFNVKNYISYTVSPIVSQVNWPQKLMNDMQVLYPDLNWGTLIATDGWLDTLGQFDSAYSSGEFITSGNSSNTTAVGLLLAEFFLSVAKESEFGYAKYEYESIFNEDVVKALMLATLGEYEYKNLSMQAEVFVDLFNVAFAPILEDVARARGISIVDGTVDNFVMSVYKYYLATALLSSDIGEYFYKVATRVYAEYTIYDYLAAASGDYYGYLSYINGETDEDGNVIDSFTYSSFKDLVKYENTLAGTSTPTFTFNYAKAYRKLYPDTTLTDSQIKSDFDWDYEEVFQELYNHYDNVYSVGKEIKDNEDLYCYMFEVYFSIKQTLKNSGTLILPTYLQLYNSYLTGEIKRWSMIDDVSINGGASKVKNYTALSVQLQALKLGVFGSMAVLLNYSGGVTYDFSTPEGQENAVDSMKDILDNVHLVTPLSLMKESFKNSSDLTEKMKYIKDNFLNLFVWFVKSEDGNNAAWEKLKKYDNYATELTQELSQLCSLTTGSSTEKGSIKSGVYTDIFYSLSYNLFKLFSQSLNSYVQVQNSLDTIVKTSITFTLGQFGSNYVADGYKFYNLANRDYTIGSTLTSDRLAEYVYGGAFLSKFGGGAEYTSSEYEGFVNIAKVIDPQTGVLKTDLSFWDELRRFASKTADFTSKLYYLTNLNDMAENVGDDISLTSNIRVNETTYTTPEKLILEYLLDSDISTNTLVQLIFGDSTATLGENGLNIQDNTSYSKAYQLALKLEGQASTVVQDSDKREALQQYLNLLYSTDYNSSYGNYYNNNNPSDRIHIVFKKVISYLLVTEESEESYSDSAINLDNITFKDLKRLLMEGLVSYKQNPSETDKENTGRYLAIFNLISTQFNYQVKNADGTAKTVRTIGKESLSLSGENENYIETLYCVIPYDSTSPKVNIFASFSEDQTTKNMIKKLAGADNQPEENLVNLEYKELYNMNGNYDEANGDTFIICTYDEVVGKYIPVIAHSSGVSAGSGEESQYDSYLDEYGYNVRTAYYDDSHYYPIVAKGIIDAGGNPTAIRMVDYQVEFYRSSVTTTTKVNDTALRRTRTTTKSDTVGYTQYVDATFRDDMGSSGKGRAGFIGDASLDTMVNSDFSVYYIQTQYSYNLKTQDVLGGLHAIEEFTAFYKMDYQNYLILYLALATMVPIIFKAGLSAMRRVLDLGALILLGPWAIAISSDDFKAPYSTWLKNITRCLLSAFGYIIGFNIYYILMTSISTMTFVSSATVEKIHMIGGMSFITESLLNFLVRYIFVLMAAGSVSVSADLVVSIVTCGKESNAFQSSTGDMFKEVKDVIHTTIEMANKVKGIASGEALINAKDALVEMLPGASAIGRAVNTGKNIATNLEAKSMQKSAIAHGMDPGLAKQAADTYKNMVKEQREARHQQHMKRANKFSSAMGLGGDMFKDPPPILPNFKGKGKDTSKSKSKGGDKGKSKAKPKKSK